jgi:hypothetical protein
MLGSRDDKLQLAMTAVEDAGERLRLSIVRFKAPTGEVQHHWSRGQGRGFRQAEIGRVDRRRYAGIGKEREHASVGPAASGLTLIASNYQPKDAGPAAKKPRGEDGEEY